MNRREALQTMTGIGVLYCRDREHHKDFTAKGALHVRSGDTCQIRIESDTVMIVPGPDEIRRS